MIPVVLPDSRPVLDVRSVVKTYGAGETAVFALRGVSLSVERGDYVAMCKAITTIKNSEKDYQHYSTRAKEIFAEKFTAKAMAAGVENIYKNLISNNKETKTQRSDDA